MALSRTAFGPYSSTDNFGTGGFTTPSFTPPDNSLVTVVVSAISNNGTSAVVSNLTLTQSGGLTVTSRLQGGEDAAWTVGPRIFSFEVTTGAAMTVTADCGATNIYHYKVEVYAHTGYNTSTPYGATATGTGTYDGAKSITLSGAPAAESEVIAVVAGGSSNSGGGVTEGSGWTELTDTQVNDWLFAQSQVRTGSTSTSVPWQDINTTLSGAGKYAAGYAAIEILAARGSITAVGTTTPVNNSGSVTIPAGANRLAIWAIAGASSAGIVSAATLGAQAMTIGQRYPTSGTDARPNALMYLLEAIVAAFSGAQSASVTISGTVTATRGGVLTLAGVDQSSPIVDSKTGATASATSHSLPAITTEPGGILVVFASSGTAFTSTWNAGDAGFTTVFNETGASPNTQFAYKLTSGTSETPPSITTGSAAIARYSMLAIRPALLAGGGSSIAAISSYYRMLRNNS